MNDEIENTRDTNEEDLKKLDELWQENEKSASEDKEGMYVVLDNPMIGSMGMVPPEEFNAPGQLKSFSLAGRKRYSMRRFGAGKSKLYRHIF